MVILDAWMHRTPVVVWDLPLFRSIVDHGVNGLLAEDTGPASFARAIIQLLKDPLMAGRLGEAGREKALKRFSWEAVASGYLQAYEHAAAKAIPGSVR